MCGKVIDGVELGDDEFLIPMVFVEPGYVYVWCSQGSLPTVYAMN